VDAVTAKQPVVAVTQQNTARVNPGDCGDLGPRVKVGDVLGTKGNHCKPVMQGRDGECPSAVADLGNGSYFMSWSWMAESPADNPAWVEVAVLGGGVWAADAVAAQDKANEVIPGGFDMAILVGGADSDSEWNTLHVFHGVNCLVVDVHLADSFGKRIDVAAAVAGSLGLRTIATKGHRRGYVGSATFQHACMPPRVGSHWCSDNFWVYPVRAIRRGGADSSRVGDIVSECRP
jgi:hypothetical protein